MNQGSVGGGRGKGGGATRDALTNSSYFTEIALLDIIFLFDASYMAYFIFTRRFNMLTVIMCRIVLFDNRPLVSLRSGERSMAAYFISSFFFLFEVAL